MTDTTTTWPTPATSEDERTDETRSITMESLGLDPQAPLGRLSKQRGGREARPKQPERTSDGRFSAKFHNPRTGVPLSRIVDTFAEADAIVTTMFKLWVENGKPQADYPRTTKKRKSPTAKAIEHGRARAQAQQQARPTATESTQTPFDPVLSELGGKQLTVVSVGIDEKDQPILGLRNALQETFVVQVQGRL